MTHDDLVKLAAAWLRKKHPIVITEISSGAGEQPDAIGFTSGYSTLIECKVSRPDFRRDGMKYYRNEGFDGLGKYRIYCAPKGMLDCNDLPKGWGLLEENKGKLRLTYAPIAFLNHNYHREISVLVSAMRRMAGADVKGVSVKFYTFDSVGNVPLKNRATLGIQEEGENGPSESEQQPDFQGSLAEST